MKSNEINLIGWNLKMVPDTFFLMPVLDSADSKTLKCDNIILEPYCPILHFWEWENMVWDEGADRRLFSVQTIGSHIEWRCPECENFRPCGEYAPVAVQSVRTGSFSSPVTLCNHHSPPWRKAAQKNISTESSRCEHVFSHIFYYKLSYIYDINSTVGVVDKYNDHDVEYKVSYLAIQWSSGVAVSHSPRHVPISIIWRIRFFVKIQVLLLYNIIYHVCIFPLNISRIIVHWRFS